MKALLLVLALGLAACGGGEGDVKEDEETIFDPLVSNIDKANEVEAQILQSKDDLDKAIEEAEDDQ